MTITVGLVHLDDLSDAARHLASGYPALYERLFDGTDAHLLHLELHRGETPASLLDADVWVLGGSRYSVYDELPWISTALELTRELVAAERPLVGICFGHQLLGAALGGTVGAAGRWGLGVQTYRTIDPLPWFPEAAAALDLLASHRDQVLEPPPDATVWSSADYCPVAGLRVGERAWSVQGHPEFGVEIARAIYESRRHLIGDDAVDGALPSLGRRLDNPAVARAIIAFATG